MKNSISHSMQSLRYKVQVDMEKNTTKETFVWWEDPIAGKAEWRYI